VSRVPSDLLTIIRQQHGDVRLQDTYGIRYVTVADLIDELDDARAEIARLQAREGIPKCMCGHTWEQHRGHTIAFGADDKFHCSQGCGCPWYKPSGIIVEKCDE